MNKNKSYNILLVMIFAVLFYTCNNNPTGINYPPDNKYKVTITEGVWGNVWFWEGNFMPSTDNSSSEKITPVERTIYVYEATRFDAVVKDTVRYGLIKSINSNLITKINSDRDGFFQVILPPGMYSFFVKEDSLFFANELDGAGHFMAAEVTQNKVTKRQINIYYKAAY